MTARTATRHASHEGMTKPDNPLFESMESKKATPDGRPVGGFILRDGLEQAPLVITLRGRNALEVIDALCARCGGQWMVAPYAVVISPRSATAPSREK